MYDEQDPIDSFLAFVVYFVESYTDFNNLSKMNEESYNKYVEKLTLMIVFETSPRKTLDISMASIREMVRDILEARLASTDEE
jgi:hypothetical protein